MHYAESSENRDRYISRRIVIHLDDVARLFAEWIQEEVRDLVTHLQILEVEATGVLKEKIAESLGRLDDINRRQLEDCKKRMRDRVAELEEGDTRGLVEDKAYLDERLRMFEGLVSELLAIRSFVIAQELSDVPEL